MARPKKNTVDYFPHDCHCSKELKIFIDKYDNEGYAFYFRLRELLGVTPEHKYDFSTQLSLEYLLSETGVDDNEFENYLDFMSVLGLVDKELLCEKKIWIQSFVDSVESVYRTRKTPLPTKDGFLVENSELEGFPERKPGFSAENGGFLTRNSQSKGKETKVKESGVDHSPHTDIPPWVDEIGKQYPNIDVNYSYMRYRNFRIEKGRPVDENGFLSWVAEDDRKGMNLKDKDSLETTLYCVKCDYIMKVPADKTYGHICEKCDDQMVEDFVIESLQKHEKEK